MSTKFWMALIVLMAFPVLVLADPNYSGLDIINVLDNQYWFSCHFDVAHCDWYGISDGLDSSDQILEFDANEWVLGSPGLFSYVSNRTLIFDYRPWNSTKEFNIGMFFYGPISKSGNHLEIDYYLENPPKPKDPFDGKPITLFSNRLLNGTSVDLRDVIEHQGGFLPLKDLDAGDYNPNAPYGYMIIRIGNAPVEMVRNFKQFTELGRSIFCLGKFLSGEHRWLEISPAFDCNECGDYNGDGKINLEDFATMASSWLTDDWDNTFFEAYLR